MSFEYRPVQKPEGPAATHERAGEKRPSERFHAQGISASVRTTLLGKLWAIILIAVLVFLALTALFQFALLMPLGWLLALAFSIVGTAISVATRSITARKSLERSFLDVDDEGLHEHSGHIETHLSWNAIIGTGRVEPIEGVRIAPARVRKHHRTASDMHGDHGESVEIDTGTGVVGPGGYITTKGMSPIEHYRLRNRRKQHGTSPDGRPIVSIALALFGGADWPRHRIGEWVRDKRVDVWEQATGMIDAKQDDDF